MNKLIKWLKYIVFFILCFITMYLITSFIKVEVDCRKWDSIERSYVIIFTAILLVIKLGYDYETSNTNNNNEKES